MRKNILHFPVATAQSLAASFNSIPTIVQNLDNCAYQIVVTTTNSTGTFAVQASLDYAPSASGPEFPAAIAGTWVDLTLGGGTPTVAAANDQIVINLNELPFKAIRLAYTSTIAGTGVADIQFFGKQAGG